jgi:hypothetical protein
MLTCPNPTCGKKLPSLERECPRCRTDLSLLCDYVDHLSDGLTRADALTRAGELGEAMWTYLSVLEVDPDNAIARRQVGQVVTAVRQFDDLTPGRRWLRRIRSRAKFRNWSSAFGSQEGTGTFGPCIWVVLIVAALIFGYTLGLRTPTREAATPTEEKKPPPTQPDEKKRDGQPISD